MKNIKQIVVDNYIIFLIYALIGWIYEVLWMWLVVPPKHFINRGVLYGPFLPIYGFGMLILLFLLKKVKNQNHYLEHPINLIITVFVISTFIYTTAIEYTHNKIYNVEKYIKNYGIGLLISIIMSIIIVLILIKEIKKLKKLDITVIIIFLLIWLITTIIEYISHFAIEKMTGRLLWDYTYDFLNINRRVNWDASRNFAIGGTFLLYLVQPIIDYMLEKMTFRKKEILFFVFGIPMLLDFVFHVILKII